MEKFFAANPIDDEVIAAGVSGGADSLALVLRLNDWAKKNGKKEKRQKNRRFDG